MSTPFAEYRGNGDGEKRRQYNRYRDWKVAPTLHWDYYCRGGFETSIEIRLRHG